MNYRVRVRLDQKGRWIPAILTNERSESSYGLPVVVVDGEEFARRSAEVYQLKIIDREFRQLAQMAGFKIA